MSILKIDLSSFESDFFEQMNASRCSAHFSATDWLAVYSVDVHRLAVEIKRLEKLLQRCIPFLQNERRQRNVLSEFGPGVIKNLNFDEAQALLAELDAQPELDDQPEVRSCTNCGSFAGYPDQGDVPFCCSKLQSMRTSRVACQHWNAKTQTTIEHVSLNVVVDTLCPLCGRSLITTTGVLFGPSGELGSPMTGPWHVECRGCRLHGPEALTPQEARSRWLELVCRIQERGRSC